MSLRLMLLLFACGWTVLADDVAMTAADIMQRVAVNQDREQKARMQFVYDETVHRTMRRKNGDVIREETKTFTVTPIALGVEKQLTAVKGRFWKKGRYVAYDGRNVPDEGLFTSVFDDETGDAKGTKDGVDQELFPLTSHEQAKYSFELRGKRTIRERDAYRIAFRPADPKEWGWAGEALIDAEEFQPVSIYTQLSRRLPLAVRTVLGTDVPGLGFSVQYTRVEKDLWFPSTYGTEFGVHALFLLNRTFTESGENKNFRRTSAESTIRYESGATTQ